MLSLALLTLFISFPRHFFAAPLEQSAHWCQCVEYVMNRSGFSMGSGPYFTGAADMGPFLESRGFARMAEPTAGAIVVFPRSFGYGIDTTYGHVGVVTEVQNSGYGWSIVVRGARQSGPEWTEYGCNNVSDMYGITVSYGSSGASFYSSGSSGSAELSAPAPGRLQLVDSLALSSVNPQIGEQVYARFSVQNTGGQALLLDQLTVGGRQGSSWDDVVVVDFPYVQQITLAPGEVYHYEGVRTFDSTGSYFAQPVAKIAGSWNAIAGEDRVHFTVQGAEDAALVPQQIRGGAAPDARSDAEIHAQWTGQEYLDEGDYLFRVQAGQGIRVYLDGELVLDGLEPQETYEATRAVSGGPHRLKIVVYEDNDGSQTRYDWERQP
jgi:hypothetical protein